MRHLILPWAISLILAANPAHATLIERDFLSPGDSAITFDTKTGLEWLDLTVTQGRFSYDSIQVELLPGKEFYGFRYATKTEVDNLLSEFGISLHPLTSTGNDHAQIEQYFSLLGITQTDHSNIGVQNYWSFGLFDEIWPDYVGDAHFYLSILENFAFGYTAVSYYPWLDYRTDRSLGHFLVRTESIPEPSSVSLIAFGFVIFLALRQRKQALALSQI